MKKPPGKGSPAALRVVLSDISTDESNRAENRDASQHQNSGKQCLRQHRSATSVGERSSLCTSACARAAGRPTGGRSTGRAAACRAAACRAATATTTSRSGRFNR
jgi:hypothetical protein